MNFLFQLLLQKMPEMTILHFEDKPARVSLIWLLSPIIPGISRICRKQKFILYELLNEL